MTTTAPVPKNSPPSVSSQMEKEFQFYLDHQIDLVEKHFGKYLVIKNQDVIGVFESRADAYTATSKEHAVGTFLIQHCLPGTQAFTATYHSRVL